jgi:hypothetical protein
MPDRYLKFKKCILSEWRKEWLREEKRAGNLEYIRFYFMYFIIWAPSHIIS